MLRCQPIKKKMATRINLLVFTFAVMCFASVMFGSNKLVILTKFCFFFHELMYNCRI
jgi:hypothetical protein